MVRERSLEEVVWLLQSEHFLLRCSREDKFSEVRDGVINLTWGLPLEGAVLDESGK